MYLASIDALRKNEQPPKNAKVAQSFKRRAKMVRNFVDRMKKPRSETWAGAVAQRSPWPPPFAWSRFPERELLSYAEACERGEAFFSRQPHHARDPQSLFIVKLLNFVRLYTGEAHLKELATLLKRPCDDVGMNVSRLDQLLRDHKARYPEVHREAEQAKAGIGAFLVEQILSEPPDS